MSLFQPLLLCAASVHPDTINDIASVESGFNPYAGLEIILKGERGSWLWQKLSVICPKVRRKFHSYQRNLKQKRRYSVGLMQRLPAVIFLLFHVRRKPFDFCENLSVFEKIIVDCYKRGGVSRMRLVVTIQEILVTVSEKKKNLIIQVMLSELVTGTKNMLYCAIRSNGEKRRTELSGTNASVISARNHSEICFVDNSHPHQKLLINRTCPKRHFKKSRM